MLKKIQDNIFMTSKQTEVLNKKYKNRKEKIHELNAKCKSKDTLKTKQKKRQDTEQDKTFTMPTDNWLIADCTKNLKISNQEKTAKLTKRKFSKIEI